VFEQLNKYLASRTYLVAERVTLADIAVAASMYHLFKLVADAGFRKAFGNVTRWYLTIVNQANVKPVFGDVVLADKAQVAPDAAPVAVKAEKPKEVKAEKPKEEKPKKEQKPKDADEEEEENFEDEAPKSKNPLDQLPPSKLVMDEWKRMYSNNDTRTVAMPWFWEHFDAEGYSLWFCRYKYNSELEKSFMTANLIGGFLQRLEKLRKYGFGSMIIFGQDPTLEIEGAWLVRGTEVPAELSTCDDYELYEWKRVDIGDAAQRSLVQDFWAWDGDFAARSALWSSTVQPGFNQAKIFK
jgi:elongation factor 1-gamma